MEILTEEKKSTIAVIVAIENYRFSDKTKGITPVKYAKRDAECFKQLLIENFEIPSENITLWINEEATKTALEHELPYLIRQLTAKDRFIFYYAGHGFYNTDSNRLTVWDSHINNLYETTVSLKESLLLPLQKSKCEQSLLFIDACSTHISAIGESRELISDMTLEEFRKFGEKSKYSAVFCSCSPGEKSYHDESLEHGIWTFHLIEALKGNAPEAIMKGEFITDSSLKDYLSRSIPDYITRKTFIRGTQTPWAEIDSSNTFIVHTLPTLEPEVASPSEFEYPVLKFRFEDMELRRTESEHYKKLSGYKKGHFEPKAGHSGKAYIQSISVKEVEDEMQEVYENTKRILGLRRNEIEKDAQAGGGVIETKYFRYYLDVYQDKSSPADALIKRRLLLRSKRKDLPEDFDDIFPVALHEVVIPISGDVEFDSFVEKFEILEDHLGGNLSENDVTGLIEFTTADNLKIVVNTKDKELIIFSKGKGCLELIDYAAEGIKKLTGEHLMLLP